MSVLLLPPTLVTKKSRTFLISNKYLFEMKNVRNLSCPNSKSVKFSRLIFFTDIFFFDMSPPMNRSMHDSSLVYIIYVDIKLTASTFVKEYDQKLINTTKFFQNLLLHWNKIAKWRRKTEEKLGFIVRNVTVLNFW